MTIRDYDPKLGQAFQGDVSIVPIPPDIVISTKEEISPREGRLILQEGEATGHHHAIELPRERALRDTHANIDPVLHVRDSRVRRAFGGRRSGVGTARLYRDPGVTAEMARRGVLTRSDLAIGCLVIEDGPCVVVHDEHDGIRLPVGHYLICGQVESAGAEERKVLD